MRRRGEGREGGEGRGEEGREENNTHTTPSHTVLGCQTPRATDTMATASQVEAAGPFKINPNRIGTMPGGMIRPPTKDTVQRLAESMLNKGYVLGNELVVQEKPKDGKTRLTIAELREVPYRITHQHSLQRTLYTQALVR